MSQKKGRTKIREINADTYELIYYKRPDTKNSKVSTYEVISLGAEQAQALKVILSESVGILVVVEKKRELLLHWNTRIHLDMVSDLGAYVELETVVRHISMEEARREHAAITQKLRLNDGEVCEGSYSDLLLKTERRE